MNFGTRKQLTYAACLLILASVSLAIPTPKGIDGTIYELDGLTPVPNGIYFEITNLNTNEIVSGKTGPWGSGAYSASLGGNDFDQILVKAWSDFNTANETFTLMGVLHNANLLLNMSIPTLPPTFDSVPPLVAYKNQQYSYQANASDINNDILSFYLIESPDEMSISNDGFLQWTPTGNDIGHHFVSIAVTDGIFTITQDYLLFVENVNAPPIITSTPLTTAVAGRIYRYDVNATDPNGDSLTYSLLHPIPRMRIDNQSGLIEWRPRSLARQNVTVTVSDGNASASQSFVIVVRLRSLEGNNETQEDFLDEDSEDHLDKIIQENVGQEGVLQSSSGSGTTSNAGFSKTDSPKTDVPEDQVKIPTKSEILSLPSIEADVEELEQRPSETEALDRQVYRYFRIEYQSETNAESTSSDIEISFRVENDWLEKKNIPQGAIVLSRHTNKWNELPTTFLTQDEHYSYYSSITSGFSYFAIHSSQDIAQEPEQPVSSSINAPYQLSGIVYFFGKRKQIPSNTEVMLSNQKTNETIILRTGTGQLSGAFSLFIKGNYSDPIVISVPEFGQTFKTTLADNNALHLSLSLRNSGIVGISGFSIAEGIEPSLLGAMVALLAVLLMAYAQTLIYKKKKKKK